MTSTNIYQDIATRTGGDIYIGVVGPVRCGKSTFIKRFMETSVVPNIKGEYDRKRTMDELPQSAGGKSVMTTEPKFVPDEAVPVSFGDGATMRVKMIDCVGYLVPEALGTTENGEVRMVKTPWSEEQVPFEEAAEVGTRKVICDHSTVGMLVTCDGSFGDISRENYVQAEERIAKELQELGKPFAIILNSSKPESEQAEALAMELEAKYNAPVALINCLALDAEDVGHILEMLLYEFPIREINLQLPGWVSALPKEHKLTEVIINSLSDIIEDIKNLNDVTTFADKLADLVSNEIEARYESSGAATQITSTDLGTGVATVALSFPQSMYYNIICDLTGICVRNEKELISVMLSLSDAKRELDKYSKAIEEMETAGYGIVLPGVEGLKLEEPEIIRQSGAYGVKLKASAPSIHMIKATIETEINPIVGSEEQSEEMIRHLMSEFEEDPQKIWESNIFGKSLYQLVDDGLHTKLAHLSEESRDKLSDTLSRIVNEGSSGLICIIL